MVLELLKAIFQLNKWERDKWEREREREKSRLKGGRVNGKPSLFGGPGVPLIVIANVVIRVI